MSKENKLLGMSGDKVFNSAMDDIFKKISSNSMKVKDLFKDGREYTTSEVKQILKNNNKKRAHLWINIRGWDIYWTTEPTIATPAGNSHQYICVD